MYTASACIWEWTVWRFIDESHMALSIAVFINHNIAAPPDRLLALVQPRWSSPKPSWSFMWCLQHLESLHNQVAYTQLLFTNIFVNFGNSYNWNHCDHHPAVWKVPSFSFPCTNGYPGRQMFQVNVSSQSTFRMMQFPCLEKLVSHDKLHCAPVFVGNWSYLMWRFILIWSHSALPCVMITHPVQGLLIGFKGFMFGSYSYKIIKKTNYCDCKKCFSANVVILPEISKFCISESMKLLDCTRWRNHTTLSPYALSVWTALILSSHSLDCLSFLAFCATSSASRSKALLSSGIWVQVFIRMYYLASPFLT